MMPKVAIIILNWNGWEDSIECLESIYKIFYPSYDIILVDNASEDDSLEQIHNFAQGNIQKQSKSTEYNSKKIFKLNFSEDEFHDVVQIHSTPIKSILITIKNDKNYGFAEGNNIGIRFALKNLKPDYVLLLNNDTVVDKDFLTELIAIAEDDNQNGFVGPKTYFYEFNDRKDIINFAGGTLNLSRGTSQSIGFGEVDNGQHDRMKIVDYVEGSCMLIKSEVLKMAGSLDKRYFAYWEETDLCIRGSELGYKSVYAPKAKIWHKVSASTSSPAKIYYYYRNRFWFVKKHSKRGEYLKFLSYFFVFEFLQKNKDFLFNGWSTKNFAYLKYFLRGVFDGLK